ncbi:enoyl-CoA hydratase/isomerase family protein [Haloechinothrix salitolerans]
MLVQSDDTNQATTFGNVLFEQDGGILWVTLNRTIALNAINSAMADQLREMWARVRAHSDIHSIVISAAGSEAFCVGFDTVDPPKPMFEGTCGEPSFGYISPKECGVEQRVVVAVNGIACRDSFRFLRDADVVIAARNASFFEPRLGIRREDGSSPYSKVAPALRVLIASDTTIRNPVTADQAMESGLVWEIAPLASLRTVAGRVAREGCPFTGVCA